ncbi:hypothetical protein KYY02_25845 [Streptomyces pimonensis]|uniref:Uncharacterized protein n=1 Tax=Streptomyces pimonensis TaxID=2860288 RepID=A0ABV4J4W8_9ACTN
MAEHPNAQLARRGCEAFTRGDMETLRSMRAADGPVMGRAPACWPVIPRAGDFKGR